MSFFSKKILITGSSGYLGKHLCNVLMSKGARCIALTNSNKHFSKIYENLNNIETFSIDLSLPNADEILLRKFGVDIDHIFHLAVAGVNQSQGNPIETVKVNICSTLNILNYAKKIDPESVVITGSGFEYPSGLLIQETVPPAPLGVYAATKAASSMTSIAYAQIYDLPITVLRPFVVYGPGEVKHRLVRQLCNAVIKNEPLVLGSGKPVRDWVYVDDAINAYLLASLSPKSKGEIINVASGKPVSVRALSELLIKETKSNPNLFMFDYTRDRENEIWEQTGSTKKAFSLLRWKSETELRNGLIKTLSWYKKNVA